MENLLVPSEVRALPIQMCSILPKHSAADVKCVCAADFHHIQYKRCVHINNRFNKMARSLPAYED